MKPNDYKIVQSLSYKFVNFDFYHYPNDLDKWLECPFCKQKPQVWSFNNGRETACGCLLEEYNQYNHFAICAESVMSVYKRTGNTKEYDSEGLRKNWNHFCETGEILFEKSQGGREDGRW